MRQCYVYAIVVWMLIALDSNLSGQNAPVIEQASDNKPALVQPLAVKPIVPQPVQSAANIAPQAQMSAPVIQQKTATPILPASDIPQEPVVSKANQESQSQIPMSAQQASQPLVTPSLAPFKSPVKIPEVEQEEPQGLDTVNAADGQGNWLFKRMWWQRAETQYEKIKSAVESIMESRMAFFAKRTEWDKTIFDPFYQDSGLGRGVLEELISSLINQLNQERSHEGQLDEKERDLLTALESQKAVLEQLQKDVQKINDIDNAVDQAISVLIKQINVARNFEKQSWQNFKAIAQELNDKKARELYYGMVTYWQNINDIGQYIQMPFLQHFEKLGAMAKDQTEKVSDALKALKEKGIDFKKQWQQLEENNTRQRDDAKDLKKESDEAKKAAEEAQAAQQGFFSGIVSSITHAIATTWDYIKSAGQGVWDFTIGRFFSKKTEEIDHSAPQDEASKENASIDQTASLVVDPIQKQDSEKIKL